MGACQSCFRKVAGAPEKADPPLTPPPSSQQQQQDPSALHHRLSMDDGVKHLVRHRRFHKFRGVSKFGLNGSFQAVKMVGRGGTGQTWLCKDLAAGGDLVALKLQERPIPSDTVTMTFNEIMVQSTEGDGVFLTRIRDVLLSPTHLALSLEYEAGGNLAEYVARRLPQVGRDELAISEDEVRYLFRQLMAGIASLHRHHIAHRDIKLDNVLLDGNDPPTLKLADFQFAYMAPEILETRTPDGRDHNYDPAMADVYAAGIMLLAMLVGAFPYDHASGSDIVTAEREVWEQQQRYTWNESKYIKPFVRKLSRPCVDLLDRMLQLDPAKRISVAGVQMHPWSTMPLPPKYQAAWDKLDAANKMVTERAELQLDKAAVEARNQILYDVVSAAATLKDEPKSRKLNGGDADGRHVVDWDSIPGGVRINMRPSAVAVT